MRHDAFSGSPEPSLHPTRTGGQPPLQCTYIVVDAQTEEMSERRAALTRTSASVEPISACLTYRRSAASARGRPKADRQARQLQRLVGQRPLHSTHEGAVHTS